ncbi:energy-coupling factor transporter transmembrane protein EcfT [Carnobacterium sp. CS13]|uniref:energy-coupling factor transporter transmembrane component T n=1 Tax=Carnobacterium sp. CS13 TaxID=2800128 RepID=UPI001912DB15|nr:energy-coupling factor transporter transmembrane component T [Carnobacterium sp. CS13]QQP70718.1 energy-coupling factor transporter transmembrane protein EcfT [Carnobacterium sp. CS13]
MQLDPRTKMVILLWCNYILLSQVQGILEVITIFLLALLFILADKGKTGVTYLLIFLGMILVDKYVIDQVSDGVSMVLIFFAVSLRLMLPCIMAGTYLMQTTTVGELTLGLRKLRTPESILIPVIVMVRFLPAIKQDYQHIRDAMKFRGIFLSKGDMVKQPVRFFEYIIIPMMMSAGNTAQDLTIASLAKGISRKNKHTSIERIGFNIQDIFCLTLIIGFVYLHQVL